MRLLKFTIVCLILTGTMSSCFIHKRAYRRHGDMPRTPPGYQGM